MRKTLLTSSLVALYMFTAANNANAGSTNKPSREGKPQTVAACIAAGRENGDSDDEIAERCLPEPELKSLSDYE